MSSDSDLDYESADEDTTEHDISEKEKISETSKGFDKISGEIAAGKNAPKVDSSTTDVTSKLPSSQSEPDNTDSSEVFHSEPSTGKEKDEPRVGADASVTSSELKFPEEIKVKHEKQRVPLRLEKKRQQKSQFSKESSVEKKSQYSRESSVEKRGGELFEGPSEEKKNQLSKDSSEDKANSNDKSNSDAQYNIPPAVDKGKTSSWGFGGWGTSLLSSAASSVSSFSNQVSQGIGTVLETVESTLGAPSPEDLASVLREKRESSDGTAEKTEVQEEDEGLGILPDVSAWTKAIENTGSKVLMGGLDTLELIGKKTMDILTEGDPGLRSKRTLFTERVNLSQILREAKEKADKESENNCASDIDVIHYSQIFDDQQGLVHLEALEMLSKQTQAKFQRLLMRHSRKEEVKKRIEEIKSICENIPGLDDPSECEGFEDFESVFKKHVLELSLPLNVDNIIKTQRQLCETLSKFENVSEEPYIDPDEIYRSSICSLAEFTARCIETFHKVAELILVQKNLSPDLEQCATNLTGLTTVMGIEVNNLSSKYHKCLDSSGDHFPNFMNNQGLNITAMVTNLYVEASNSNKYIQDAFLMLVPVLQVCLLESIEE
ncbi:protein FAM114A2 [Parasteatoda tepidariorum]|uniref:protein FAM114A2 n=1 Tax=Parasteatoda tepidariorum TaxID=114398 RepID=UPI001C717E29|nr:protein FAM114A2 [Parasteatoda tepidariorum]